MTNKTYDILCIVQRWLTGLGVLYLALAEIWCLPFGNEVNQSIVAICAFLAIIIEVQKSYWNKSHKISITEFKEGANKE